MTGPPQEFNVLLREPDLLTIQQVYGLDLNNQLIEFS